MTSIDWPLAGALAAVFAVSSLLRWRYFSARARRRQRDTAPPDGAPK